MSPVAAVVAPAVLGAGSPGGTATATALDAHGADDDSSDSDDVYCPRWLWSDGDDAVDGVTGSHAGCGGTSRSRSRWSRELDSLAFDGDSDSDA